MTTVITDSGWIKSSYCATNACVEVRWTRSSFCTSSTCVEVAQQRAEPCGNGSCVEVAQLADGVLVRDSKNPDQTPLSFTVEEWSTFVAGVRAGEFGG